MVVGSKKNPMKPDTLVNSWHERKEPEFGSVNVYYTDDRALARLPRSCLAPPTE